MIRSVLHLWKGCLLAALFLFGGPLAAEDKDLPRADVVACVRAVEALEGIMRGPMQNHCLVIAGNFCEQPLSGPMLACLDRMIEDMRQFVARSVPLLPDDVEVVDFRSSSIKRRLDKLHMPDDSLAHCTRQHSKTFEITLCRGAAAFGDVLTVFSLARHFGIDLP